MKSLKYAPYNETETVPERVEHNTNNIKWLKENGGSGGLPPLDERSIQNLDEGLTAVDLVVNDKPSEVLRRTQFLDTVIHRYSKEPFNWLRKPLIVGGDAFALGTEQCVDEEQIDEFQLYMTIDGEKGLTITNREFGKGRDLAYGYEEPRDIDYWIEKDGQGLLVWPTSQIFTYINNLGYLDQFSLTRIVS